MSHWQEIKNEMQKPYFVQIMEKLLKAYPNYVPDYSSILRAFVETPIDNVKVVILGQDPYPTKGNANGLAFAVNQGVKIPKSLANIFKEIQSDIGITASPCPTLIPWAKQGVLLLNTYLTTELGKPMAHHDFGWEQFTDKVISILNSHNSPKVFMLWGNQSQKKQSLITSSKHLVLTATHPSPLSAYRGFFGCKHFSKANRFLKENDLPEIKWA
jgi:uracil-DNA glycosylase